MEGTDLKAALAARWCRRHKVPELPREAQAALYELSEILLPAIHEAPHSPAPGVRVYYQAIKLILGVAEEGATARKAKS
jgi:hypothetical protein